VRAAGSPPEGTKKRLVLSGTNQDALQALFGDDVTVYFGKRVQLEPRPIRIVSRVGTVATPDA
jgi:hypothetical protein